MLGETDRMPLKHAHTGGRGDSRRERVVYKYIESTRAVATPIEGRAAVGGAPSGLAAALSHGARAQVAAARAHGVDRDAVFAVLAVARNFPRGGSGRQVAALLVEFLLQLPLQLLGLGGVGRKYVDLPRRAVSRPSRGGE